MPSPITTRLATTTRFLQTVWNCRAYLESERFLHPVLREFYKERNVVIEERRLRTDVTRSAASRTVQRCRIRSSSLSPPDRRLDVRFEFFFGHRCEAVFR